MAEVVNVGILIANALKNNLKTYRLQVIKEGNANLLNELDKIIAFVEKQSLPLKEQKFRKSDFVIGLIAMLACVIPWLAGVYYLVTLLIK